MTRLRLRPDAVEWRLVDDEVVALDLSTARYLATNRTGAVLWEELAAGTTREALVGRLADTWALDPERAAADVDAFLAALDAHGLLESV